MPGGRSKTRIPVAVEPVLVRVLDGQAKSRNVSRGAAVEEAFSEWLRRRMEEDAEASTGSTTGTSLRVGAVPAKRRLRPGWSSKPYATRSRPCERSPKKSSGSGFRKRKPRLGREPHRRNGNGA